MNHSLHNMMLTTQNRFYREILKGALTLGLSPGQPKVLEFLRDTGESTQTDICRALDLDKSTITGILARMEDAGLIIIRRDEKNKRKTLISLSKKGIDASDKMEKIFNKVDTRAWGSIPENKRNDFIETFKQIYENISKAE